jgi:hypothetical protein
MLENKLFIPLIGTLYPIAKIVNHIGIQCHYHSMKCYYDLFLYPPRPTMKRKGIDIFQNTIIEQLNFIYIKDDQ